MQLTIFGATGQMGQQLVKQACFRRHKVVAFARNPMDLHFEHPLLQIVKGTLFDEEQVLQAVTGTDAVLSAIGGAVDGTDKARSLGIRNILAQMEKAGVQRIIAVGGMGILNADEETLLMDTPGFPPEYLPVSREHQKAYEYLRNSRANWTMIGSPGIINDGPTGSYLVQRNHPPDPNLNRINAGDLAQFMLNEIERNEFEYCRVGITAASVPTT